MVRTGIQLYTLRELEGGFPTLLRRVSETDFDGVEFAGFGETSPDEAATVFEEVGLEVAGVHVGTDALKGDPGGAAETCVALDCDRVVVLYLDDIHFENAAVVRKTATWLSALADRFADRGLTLGYHNHDHEFVDLAGDERSAFALLIDETDDALSIELEAHQADHDGKSPDARTSGAGRRRDPAATQAIADDVTRVLAVPAGDVSTDLDASSDLERRRRIPE